MIAMGIFCNLNFPMSLACRSPDCSGRLLRFTIGRALVVSAGDSDINYFLIRGVLIGVDGNSYRLINIDGPELKFSELCPGWIIIMC